MIAGRFDLVSLPSRAEKFTHSSSDQEPPSRFDRVLAEEMQSENDGPKGKQLDSLCLLSQGGVSEKLSLQSWKSMTFDDADPAQTEEREGEKGGDHYSHLLVGGGAQFPSIAGAVHFRAAIQSDEQGHMAKEGEFQAFAPRQLAHREGPIASVALEHPELSEPGLVEIRHVSLSTHFSLAGDSIRQISQNVVNALGEPDLTSYLMGQNGNTKPPVKVLNVLLQPESLGAVTLQMKLSGNQLSIRVEVSEPGTLEMIRKDQDRLYQSLQMNEIAIERLEIRPAVSEVAAPNLQLETATRSDHERRAGSDLFSGEGKARDERNKQDQDRRAPQAPNQASDDRHSRRSGLYL